MIQKVFLIIASNPMTMVDYYKLWQPLSGQQFGGKGMYGSPTQDVGAYDKENLDKQS
jgi:hypothetical protein